MKLFLMRHGQTASNLDGMLQGRINTPLNEEGIRQAELVRDEISSAFGDIDIVFSSPLDRAKHTASIVSNRDNLIIDQRIIEFDFGPFDGVRGHDAKGMYHFFKYPHTHGNIEGVESYESVMERTIDFMEDIIADPDLHGKNILVLTHGGILHAMLLFIDELEISDFWKQDIGNCGYFVAELERGKLRRVFADFKEQNRIHVFKKDSALNK